jgi:hypothetical protein
MALLFSAAMDEAREMMHQEEAKTKEQQGSSTTLPPFMIKLLR